MPAIGNETGSITIGRFDGVKYYYFNGRIDDVRIYDETDAELGPNEVGTIYMGITQADFERDCGAGRFALSWRGNGLGYGVGMEIDLWLAFGRHVILNGSRDYLSNAAMCYPSLLPVLIAIDPAVLRQRLAARGRLARRGIGPRGAHRPRGADRRERGAFVVSDRESVLIDHLSPHYLTRVIRVDPWHRPYHYEGQQERYSLRSLGPDGKPNTPDDIVVSGP